PDELKFRVVEAASAELRSRHRVMDVDGVRVLFEQGWGLVRASNTQPVLVMRFEATTPELLRAYRSEVEEVVGLAKKKAGSAEPATTAWDGSPFPRNRRSRPRPIRSILSRPVGLRAWGEEM